MTHRQFVGIDALRFLAAGLVASFHLGAGMWLLLVSLRYEVIAFPELLPFARNGWVGVDIFFVISGFVIAYSADGTAPGDFARSRFLRLVPGAWICASLTLAAALSAGLGTLEELALPYANTVLFSPLGPCIDGVYWTLGVELAFYGVIFALLFLRAWDRMPFVVGAVGLASAAFHATILLVPSLAWLAQNRAVELCLLQHGCLFALGAILWLCLSQAATRARLAMVAILLGACALEVASNNAYFMRMLGIEGSAAAPLAVFIVAVAALVASVVWNDRLVAMLGRRGVSLTRTVGLATYPFYLIHNVCGALLLRFFVDAGLPRGLALACALGTVTAVSLVVTRTAEPPLRRLLARTLFGRPSSRRPALGAA